MATAHRIHDIVYDYPTADVEDYFVHMNEMIQLNSGINDYRTITHDCFAVSAPVKINQNTKFRLTDSSLDIIDISQGFLNLTCEFNVEMKCPEDLSAAGLYTTHYRNATWFFVGFKSGAQLIKSYSVFSNGQPTACKQTRSTEEQTIVFNCKAKEEKDGRPGMYSVHKDVLKMRDCVCGTYIQQPMNWRRSGTGSVNGDPITIKLDISIQVDDLLPFSGMTYFPRFLCGELELEIKATLEKNLVFCQVPYEEVLKLGVSNNPTLFNRPQRSKT